VPSPALALFTAAVAKCNRIWSGELVQCHLSERETIALAFHLWRCDNFGAAQHEWVQNILAGVLSSVQQLQIFQVRVWPCLQQL
jgi:hypothetical protein